MLKGMTPEQFTEILKFVQDYHHFARYVSQEKKKKELKLYPNIGEHGLSIKYVDSCYDSRGKEIWSITFRSFSQINFRTNAFISLDRNPIKYHNLYDWVMAYLKGDWRDEEIIKTLKK